jgi:hypothetical protein
MQMIGWYKNQTMFIPNSKLHAYKVVAKLSIPIGQNTMFIPRSTILYSARKVGHIAKFINQLIQHDSSGYKTK